ncbi:PREDICTED: disease [Prunus dulcis]|uniref:PREDICTED: disease n=1 Tax=Prunus dulcis TaxID=3755 RepID=A0A5E4F7R3_PRUDU|nr:disease resistance protein RPP13-like [Prunus dulcis]VVA23967.1 PREDICTED: disease [Prunus dulcis]
MAVASIACWILFAIYVVAIAASEITFRHLNAKYKWIRRESRLLTALLEDFDHVSRSRNKIIQKANHQLLDPQLIQAGMTARVLNEWEEGWMNKAREVASEATRCVRILGNRRTSPKWFVLISTDLVPMLQLALRMKGLNHFLGKKKLDVDPRINPLNSLLWKKKISASDICRSLEQSRSWVSSLQNRSVVDEILEQSTPWTGPPVSLRAEELISSIKNLIAENPEFVNSSTTMHLELLHAFMKDLQPLRLETEMEKSWVVEANETIDEANEAIHTINITAADQRSWWLSIVCNRRDRRKLKEVILRVGTWISDLLETKERYGFKFVRRQSSKLSANRFPQQRSFKYQTTDDMDAVNNIRNWLNQLAKTSDELVSHVSALSEELEQMHTFLKHTKATEDYAINLRNACLEQLKKLVPEADQQSSNVPNNEGSGSKLLSKITRINYTVNVLQRCVQAYFIEARQELCSVVGLEEDIHELVKRLADNGEQRRPIISIVGMKGVGKTTLAKKVYYHSTMANHFEIRRWVTLPDADQDSDVNALLASVGSQVLETQEKGDGKEHWIDKLHGFLKPKRYLVILDGVLSIQTVHALKAAFPEVANGSKILLTTRKKAIASAADQNSIPHQLRLRTKEESWELFTQMAHCPPELEALGKKVVGRGGGLPLVILRIGYPLSGKKVTSEELEVLEGITQQEQNQKPWLENLEVNKEDLQSHQILGKCFSYFQLFSGNFEIPARRIVTSWVAQGLAQVSGGGKTLNTLENVVYEYLLELIGRNVIQVVQKNLDGKVKTCCLPTALRDLMLQGEGNSSKATSLSGQLAFHFDDKDARFHSGVNANSPMVMQNESQQHSILLFDSQEGNKPREEIGEFLQSGIIGGFFGQLQVLDLERVCMPEIPKAIGKLRQLAYLGLRWTYLSAIPESIGNLVNLLTLDLKHTYVRILPSSVRKLKKLRHLYLNQNIQMSAPTSLPLSNLQTLSGVFVGMDKLVKDRRDKLINLRKLGLTIQLAQPEQKVLAKWIMQLTKLQSLKLASLNEKSAPQLLKLKPLSKLQKLSSLYLLGRLENPASIIGELPASLTRLTLSASGIQEDPMPMLGKLPNLKSLNLKSGSYEGPNMVCSMDTFPLLLVLKLRNLDTLKKLDVQEGAMRNLRELEIKSCRNFTITTGLTHLKILQKYEVN